MSINKKLIKSVVFGNFESDPIMDGELRNNGGLLKVKNTEGVKNLRIEDEDVIRPNIQTFTSNGTWIKPSNGTYVKIICIGGGAGGVGGSCQAMGSVRVGGAGGAGGYYISSIFPISAVASSEPVVVGAGGAGGAGATTNNGIGINGNLGGISSFSGGGSLVQALGGSASSGISAGPTSRTEIGSASQAGGASATGGAGSAGFVFYTVPFAPGGGGAGGGITSLDIENLGGNGSSRPYGMSGMLAATPGSNGASADEGVCIGGGGGGGGNSSLSGSGSDGGDGGAYGGGGGGGGSATNGNSAGSGGNGAAGIVVVITW